MAIRVEVNLKSSSAERGLGRVQKMLETINAEAAKLNANLINMGGNLGNVATQINAATNVMRGGPKHAVPAAQKASGRVVKPPLAFDNNPLAGVNYYRAGAAMGDPFASRMFLRNTRLYDQIQRAQSMAQNTGSGGPLNAGSFAMWQALMRTRFSPGGGGAGGGLVGNVLGVDIARLMGSGKGAALASLFGKGAAGGLGAAGGAVAALAGPAAVAGVAIAGLATVTMKAREALNRWTDSLVSGGGTPGEARAASRAEEALGLTKGFAARFSKGLMEGLGPAAASRMGMNPISGPLTGNMNYNANLLKALDYLGSLPRNPKGFETARQTMEMAGAPELARFVLLDPEIQKLIRNRSGGSASFQKSGAAADFDASLALAKDSFQDIVVSLGTPVLKSAAKLFSTIADVASRVNWDIVAGGITGVTRVIEMQINAWETIAKWVQWVLDKIREMPIIRDMMRDEALNQNTQATNRNTDELRRMNGTFGGGARAQGSTPSRLRPGYDSNYHHVRLGVL